MTMNVIKTLSDYEEVTCRAISIVYGVADILNKGADQARHLYFKDIFMGDPDHNSVILSFVETGSYGTERNDNLRISIDFFNSDSVDFAEVAAQYKSKAASEHERERRQKEETLAQKERVEYDRLKEKFGEVKENE